VSEQSGGRLDVFLARELAELSRSRIQALLKSGHILVNGTKARAKAPVAAGDRITIELPEPVPSEILPEDIPLAVVFEDRELLVVDKAVGMVVHPAAGNPDGTLVNALLHHCKNQLPGIGGVERPGIVHRLDKDTSGCIVAAKTESAQQSLLDQFAERRTTKLYLCATQRIPTQPSGTIFTNIGRHPVSRQKMAVVNPGTGRSAITAYHVLARNEEDNTALVLCVLHTGRTHQIRVHMKHIGCALLGDPIYAQPARQSGPPTRLMLHAWRLGFAHPRTGLPVIHEAPIPPEFSPWLDPEALTLVETIRHTAPGDLEALLESGPRSPHD
jgi:23S rRNA pseudouridine1911/1915/1917 synthase